MTFGGGREGLCVCARVCIWDIRETGTSSDKCQGVNDDGSGSAALLEIARSLSRYSGYANKVRLAWWGAEESGLVGSLYHVSQMSERELDAVRFYFNYDMIGSPVPFYHVYADTDAHKVGGQILVDYLEAQGHDVEYG